MKAISNVASWVFLPLFMPIYALLVVFYVPSNQDYLFNEDCMYLMHDTNKLVVLFEYEYFFGNNAPMSWIITPLYVCKESNG